MNHNLTTFRFFLFCSQFNISGECEFADTHISNVVVFQGNTKNRWLADSDPQPDNDHFAVPAAIQNDSQYASDVDEVLISDSESDLSNSVIILE